MKKIVFPLLLMATIAACSETPIEEQGDEAVAEMEGLIDREAQSLQQAADEAVKALEEEIDAELADDGIAAPQPQQTDGDSTEGE